MAARFPQYFPDHYEFTSVRQVEIPTYTQKMNVSLRVGSSFGPSALVDLYSRVDYTKMGREYDPDAQDEGKLPNIDQRLRALMLVPNDSIDRNLWSPSPVFWNLTAQAIKSVFTFTHKSFDGYIKVLDSKQSLHKFTINQIANITYRTNVPNGQYNVGDCIMMNLPFVLTDDESVTCLSSVSDGLVNPGVFLEIHLHNWIARPANKHHKKFIRTLDPYNYDADFTCLIQMPVATGQMYTVNRESLLAFTEKDGYAHLIMSVNGLPHNLQTGQYQHYGQTVFEMNLGFYRIVVVDKSMHHAPIPWVKEIKQQVQKEIVMNAL